MLTKGQKKVVKQFVDALRTDDRFRAIKVEERGEVKTDRRGRKHRSSRAVIRCQYKGDANDVVAKAWSAKFAKRQKNPAKVHAFSFLAIFGDGGIYCGGFEVLFRDDDIWKGIFSWEDKP